MSKLRQMESSVGLNNSMHYSLEAVKQKLKESLKKYNEFKKRAKVAKKTLLEDLA